MKKLIFLILAICPTLAFPQIDLEEDLSKYYQKAKKLYSAREQRLSMVYLDSSFAQYSSDSIEMIYALTYYAKNLERLTKYDSAMLYYDKAFPMARSLSTSKIPLWFILLERGVHYHQTERLAKSNYDLKEALRLTPDDAALKDFRTGWAYRTLAYNYLRNSRLDTVHVLLEGLINSAEKANHVNLTKETYFINGYYAYEIGDFETALEQFQGKLDFLKVDVENISLAYSADIQNIAAMYQVIGDFERAEEYFLAVDEFHRKNDYTQRRSFYQNLQGLSELYLAMKKYEKSLNYTNEFLDVYRQLNPTDYSDPYYNEVYAYKGRGYAGLRQWDKSEEAFETAIKFFERISENDVYLAMIKLYFGQTQEEKGDYEKSLTLTRQVLETFRQMDDLTSQYAMVSFKNLAKAYESNGQYDPAMVYRDSAIWVNDQFSSAQDENLTIRYAQPLSVTLIEQLQLYKKIWQSDPKPQYMDRALQTIDRTNHVINYLRQTIKSDNNRLSTARDFYDLAIFFYSEKYKISGKMEDLARSLSFVENNKSFLLNEMKGENAKMETDILQQLLAQKKHAKQMLKVYTIRKDANQKVVYYEKLDSIQQILDRSNDYDHFRSITEGDIKSLSKQSDILSFHWSPTQLYCYFISEGNIAQKIIDIDSTFSKEILELRQSLTSPNSEIRKLSTSRELVDFLKSKVKSQLTIVPDGPLHYIPFEILPIGDFSDSILLDICNVRYLNSLYDLIDDQPSGRLSGSLLSFAPEFSADNLEIFDDPVRGELSKLPGAFEEVNGLKQIFSGTTFIKNEASETNFVNNAGEFGMIHLATHAVVDDENPDKSKLVFNLTSDSINDGYLHAYEIYNLDLNAQLVTLSACNTGFGQIKKGEGVMSLSRAFAYAGIPATVVSLWPASDKSTPALMKHFYQNLKEGQTKSMALNNARKQYLATATGKARHPFYWGGFVLIGDDSPIKSGNSNLASLLAILFLLTCVPLILVIKNKYLSIED